MRILIAEDERRLADAIARGLMAATKVRLVAAGLPANQTTGGAWIRLPPGCPPAV
ncbi:MAG TPA: hypothetical protein VGK95_03435 [Caldimonas sp.]